MGRAPVALIVAMLTCIVPGATAQVRIEGFATDLPDNEDAILLRNIGSSLVDLSSARLTDGNGEILFPAGASIGAYGSVFITTNQSAFTEAFGHEPHFSVDGQDATTRMAKGTRTFALSNAGDQLALRIADEILDAVVYGDEDSTAEAWTGKPVDTPSTMFLRWFPRTSEVDTDSATDWTPVRRVYAGQDLFEPFSFTVDGPFFPYVAPEHSRAMVRNTILSAERSLRINVYQFRDIELARDIADHMRTHPGLRVEVILDASPVGESKEELSERGHVIEELVAAGAGVHMFTHSRYAYDHAKYVVVDDEMVLVQTENFVPSGIPANGRDGNRGWGIIIANATIARHAASVFDADFKVKPFGARLAGTTEKPPFPAPALASESGSESPELRVDQSAQVTFLATPFLRAGADDAIVSAIKSATTSIEVVQLDLAPRWRTPDGGLESHLYLDALVDAARRGINVRILLDGHFLDDSASGDNADTVALVEDGFAGLPIEARLRSSSSSVLHAKGMVIDGRTTLVGSMNWNSNSILQNREVGILIEQPELAEFYQSYFEMDWDDASPEGIPGVDVVTILTVAGLTVLVKGRRRR